MTQLHIDIKNCYGIGELKHDITFKPGSNACVIYAPNGTMKTSFTNTISDLLAEVKPKDMIFLDRLSSSSITLDGVPISKDNCYVFNNEKENGAASISTFLANHALKSRYDDILNRLDRLWIDLKKKIASDARSSDCGEEILKAFSSGETISIFECLTRIYHLYFEIKNRDYPLYKFKYNNVFDKNGRVKTFVNENLNLIRKYFVQYQNVISNSVLFSAGVESFGTYQAAQLLKSVDDDRFFKASHKMVLKNGKKIVDKSQLKQLFETEINKVLNDEELKRAFDALEKKLGTNTDLRNFKETVRMDPTLVSRLTDYEQFRKMVLLGYLSHNIIDLKSLVVQYETEKKNILKIIEEANKGIDRWKNVIDLFNNRFYVPFEVYIKNQSDVILKENSVSLGFLYRENDALKKDEDQTSLLHSLSTGEARAFHILQNLFEIEARKFLGKSTLLILDDIADSFDYKNKYAIVEYLADLMNDEKFMLVILTHNFDFYRTVVSRLGVKKVFFASKDADRKISLSTGIFKSDILKRKFIAQITQRRQFIGLIPFVRNLIEYSDGAKSSDYMCLTSCLHIKGATKGILVSTIFDIFKRHLYGVSNKNIDFGYEKYLNILFAEADAILNDTDEVDLANKLVLSIAIRLRAEFLLFEFISKEHQVDINVGSNQTGELVRVLKKYYSDSHQKLCLLMDKVVMLTSENIHVNNFMFEPLVDISSLHLKQLYRDIANLTKDGL